MESGEPFQTSEMFSRRDAAACRRSDVRHHLREGLGLLLLAYEYAAELGQDVWDLAVELPVLRAARVTISDIRWLAAKRYIECAVESTEQHDKTRQFWRGALLTFSDSTCIVLTPSGAAVAREVCTGDSTGALCKPAASILHAPASVELSHRPNWDQQRRQLRVGSEIVKEFKLPSPNQEMILTALEEEGWPPRIDDPLPPTPQLEPRRRLHDTIKALNRNQKRELVRFRGDGSGEGIRWEFNLCDGRDRSPSAPIA